MIMIGEKDFSKGGEMVSCSAENTNKSNRLAKAPIEGFLEGTGRHADMHDGANPSRTSIVENGRTKINFLHSLV